MVTRKTARCLAAAVALLLPPAVPAAAQSAPDEAVRAEGTADRSEGDLTVQAFQARRERKLMAADTDGDGRIGRAEFLAAAGSGKGDPGRRFAAMDRNGDGMVDKAEMDAALARRFERRDTNGDGVLSAGERAAARTWPGQGGTDS